MHKYLYIHNQVFKYLCLSVYNIIVSHHTAMHFHCTNKGIGVQLRKLKYGRRTTGEPPNNGHIGDRSLVLCREVVPISEVVLVPSKKDPPALVSSPAVQRARRVRALYGWGRDYARPTHFDWERSRLHLGSLAFARN